MTLTPRAKLVIEAIVGGLLAARAGYWFATVIALRWLMIAVAIVAVLVAWWKWSGRRVAARQELARRTLEREIQQNWSTVTARFDAPLDEAPDENLDELFN